MESANTNKRAASHRAFCFSVFQLRPMFFPHHLSRQWLSGHVLLTRSSVVNNPPISWKSGCDLREERPTHSSELCDWNAVLLNPLPSVQEKEEKLVQQITNWGVNLCVFKPHLQNLELLGVKTNTRCVGASDPVNSLKLWARHWQWQRRT